MPGAQSRAFTFGRLFKLDCYSEQEKLTLELVGIRSVVGEDGAEAKMSEFVLGKLSELSYFKEHKKDLFLIPTANDSIKRSSVFCIVRGEKDTSGSVLLMGHTDTVEVSDFGKLESLATKPCELMAALKGITLPKEAAKDLESGDYLFGRGTLDMKSGVAAEMFAVKYYSEHRDELCGNLMALFECDEEGDSHGMISSTSVINDFCAREGLKIKCALCADYSTQKAAYLGTIGKYLPCFVSFGKTAHVGSVFDSVDPNLLSSEIVCELDYNTAYSDENLGEKSLPPVSLKLTDTKSTYSVQTAEESIVYFNWFSLKKSVSEVLDICEGAARKAAERVCAKTGCKEIRVYRLEDYAKHLGQTLNAPEAEDDIRHFWISEAERLRKEDKDRTPAIIVFAAGICYSPISLAGKPLEEAIRKTGLPVRIYYPYISDASFVSLLGDVPVVNIGSVGKDAHTYLERVECGYTFGRLPQIIVNFVKDVL